MDSAIRRQSPDGASPRSALPLHVSRGNGGPLSRESKSGPLVRNAKEVPASDAAPVLQVPSQVQSRSPASSSDSSSGSGTPNPPPQLYPPPPCFSVGNVVPPSPHFRQRCKPLPATVGSCCMPVLSPSRQCCTPPPLCPNLNRQCGIPLLPPILAPLPGHCVWPCPANVLQIFEHDPAMTQ